MPTTGTLVTSRKMAKIATPILTPAQTLTFTIIIQIHPTTLHKIQIEIRLSSPHLPPHTARTYLYNKITQAETTAVLLPQIQIRG